MSEMERRPGRIGKVTPVDQSAQSEQSHNLDIKTHAPSVVQVNTLSNPVLIVIVAVMTLVAAMSGIAIAVSWHASDKAAIAEREGRLAEEAAMHLRSTVRAYGLSIRGSEQDREHEEPIEP